MEDKEKESKRIADELKEDIPSDPTVKIPNHPKDSDGKEKKETSAAAKVDDANAKTKNTLLGLLNQSEEARLSQQKPLLVTIVVCVGAQLLLFNVVIILLIVQWWGTENATIVTGLLEFLKYYIGAVVVELIGMIVFITKSTFTSYAGKMIEKLIGSVWGSRNDISPKPDEK